MALSVGLCVVALGAFPVVNWLPGGLSAQWYGTMWAEWLNGLTVVAGGATVLGIIARRVPGVWRAGAAHPLVARADRHPVLFGVAVAALGGALYAVVATAIYSRVPITIDELVQLVQARTFAGGRLWQPASPWPEFFSTLNLVDLSGRYYGQFPPGWSAMLALGVLAGVPWMVGPLCGAVAAAALWGWLREAEPDPSVRVGAVLLFAFAPFAVFMSGSHMNHAPALMWVVIGMAAMARVVGSRHARPWIAFAGGVALGCAATIRPVDALAFALPAAAWYIVRALRDARRWSDALAAAVGVALPVGLMLWVNAQTTGAPLLFGYEVLWGKQHNLGFHDSPWGSSHTPQRGAELINLYFLRLQAYLYEAPVPSLLPAAGALVLARRASAFDRYLFASSALVVGFHFAYWHDGFRFGPRFLFALLPLLALWTARLPTLVRDRFGHGLFYRFIWYGYAIAAVLAAAVAVPARAGEYARAFAPMRLDFPAVAGRANIEGALIFVRESWGSQLIARLWALGISRPDAEMLYGRIDACVLEQHLGRLERSNTRGSAALAVLVPELRDSARTVPSPWSPDRTERYLPGAAYMRVCAQRVAEDQRGFTLLAPVLYRDWGTNLYARDLHERNLVLARAHPQRPIYLLRPSSAATDAALELVALPRDSVLTAWHAPE